MLVLFLTASISSAKIWRVDSNPGNIADFRTLKNAHDGALIGDTLYVAGSAVDYGGTTITKTLFIYGPGYFLNENPDTQAYPVSARVDANITFTEGSTGSLLAGLTVNDISINKTNKITIRNTYIKTSMTISDNVSNCVIIQNYIHTTFSISWSNCQNIIISNNIINPEKTSTDGFICNDSNSSSDIQYNLIGGNVTINNSIFHNNICFDGSFKETGCDVRKNICDVNQFVQYSDNQSNTDMSTVYIGTGSTDGKWQLKDNSPAKGAGTEGTDIGPFGGPKPYILSGIPNIPRIYFFDSPTSVTGTTGLPVHLKAKAGEY